MLNIQIIRKYPTEVNRLLKNKNPHLDISKILDLDQKIRALKVDLNLLSTEKNQLKKEGKKTTEWTKKYAYTRKQIKKIKEEYKKLEKYFFQELYKLPNISLEQFSHSPSAKNEILTEILPKYEKNFHLLSYLDLGKHLNLFHLSKGGSLCKAHFPLYQNNGAKLVRALKNFMVDFHIDNHNYQEIMPPYLVNSEVAFNSGHLPKFEKDMYSTEKKQLFLIPTSEIPLVSLHQGEILSLKLFPLKYVCASPCFRKESGKKSNGLIRTHQFEKVELLQIVQPRSSEQAFKTMIQEAEKILQLLEIPYRVVKLSHANLSFSGAYGCDIEVWCPGLKQYLEVSTISNCLDFQARRAKIRYRKSEKSVEFVHILNGSALAIPRLFVAILENYQTEKKEIQIPKALRPYFKKDLIDVYSYK